MSQWVDRYAILRDLSVAQGRGVPVRINGVIAADEKPPARHITEETEEQFFRQYMGGGGYAGAPPDLSLIQQMLEMVRLNNPPPQHTTTTSMLNPNSAEFVPQYNTNLDINDNRHYVDRRDRNVALRSLLESDNERSKMQNLRLLKPDDIIQNNMAFDRQQSPCHFLSMQPTEMFKKRSPVQKNPFPEPTPEMNNNTYNLDVYQPSGFANEYYNKCMERAKIRMQVQEDIWTKAEKKMKEIEKRKQMAAQLYKEWERKDANQNLNLVRLAHHRHVLADECVVCDTVKKHSFDVDKFLAADKCV